MKNALAHFLLIFSARTVLCEIKCNVGDDCLCLPGTPEFEFQCPMDHDQQLIIHVIEDKRVLIDCYRDQTSFHITQLPNITLNKIDNFCLRSCPLPIRFKDVLNWFSLQDVELLQFKSTDIKNVTLTADYFEGLSKLRSLCLSGDGITDLDEDVFVNTPSLVTLELQDNDIELKPNLFARTPLLKSLDLSSNKLDNLPDGLLQPLVKLENLHLWDNKLSTLNTSTFDGLFNLKSLELSRNKIDFVAIDAFTDLTSLSQINLSGNDITSVASQVFQTNKKLQKILLSGNLNLILSDYLFSNLPFLQEVDISNCKSKLIPEHIFSNSTNLKILNLEKNNLQYLPENLFQGVTHLEQINLNNNRLLNIGNIFKSLKRLKKLYLQNNLISAIDENAFADLNNLTEINLKENNIAHIHYRAFYGKNSLRIINLSHNKYVGKSNRTLVLLEDVHDVKEIDLSYNLIESIEDVIGLENKVSLEQLNLSHNRITSIRLTDLQPLSKKLVVHLESNDITSVNFDYSEYVASHRSADASSVDDNYPYAVIYLANNSIDCDCFSYDLVRYIRNEIRPEVKVMFDIKTEDLLCRSPTELKDLLVDDLRPSQLICPLQKVTSSNSACPDHCACSWRPCDKAVVIDCANKNFTQFPEIRLNGINITFNQTEMHLERNNLIVGPDSNLTGYSNITKLFLSYNEIQTLTWLPPKLEILRLDNNEIDNLNYDILHILNTSYLVDMTLNDNPWRCDCEAENLTNFLRLHPRQVDTSNIYCVNSTRLLRELNRNDLCHEWQGVYLILALISLMLVVAISAALYYRYQQELKVWLFAHNWCLWCVTEEELDKEKLYDAFISYSHKDEEFVVQNLLPVLEGGPQPYKLCLHYRNWIPGEFIPKQITNSVLDSRRTLVVLSPSFLESVWGTMEFRTAHTQAMIEGRARVIIVLYGEIDLDGLDSELKSYLKTNTYVKWGDPYFWHKLKYALPHANRNSSRNNQKLANVMNCIDDKFNLVAPITPSPGTTPPVLTLDPSLLKHPLNFIPRTEVDTPPAESGTLLVSSCL